jgi:hypothetical protein
MKNAVFWAVTPRGSCKNRHFGGAYRLYHQGEKNPLLVTANIPSSPILVTLMMEVIGSSKMSVLIGATQRNIPVDGILQSFHISESQNSMTKLISFS